MELEGLGDGVADVFELEGLDAGPPVDAVDVLNREAIGGIGGIAAGDGVETAIGEGCACVGVTANGVDGGPGPDDQEADNDSQQPSLYRSAWSVGEPTPRYRLGEIGITWAASARRTMIPRWEDRPRHGLCAVGRVGLEPTAFG